MKDKIINFISLLRESNMTISIAESIDCCRALQLCDITDKSQFKITLCSTLVKSSDNIPTFNRIFDLFFIEPFEDEQEEITQEQFENELQELIKQMQDSMFNELGNGSSDIKDKHSPFDLENDFKNYDKDKMSKDLYKHGSDIDIQTIAKQMANRNFEKWESEDINQTCEQLLIQNNMEYLKQLAKNETRKSKHGDIEKNYEKLKQNLKNEIEKAMVRQFGESIIGDIVDNYNILDKDFSDMSLDELEKIQSLIKKISKKLSTHVSRKEKHAKRGKISISKTIRSSIQFGNTSSELRFKNKKKTKPELVILCDVSGSVWMYVSFMLQLVIGIQNVFSRVNSYIFIDTIRNVTEEILQSEDLQKTMDRFLNDRTLGFGTDYGNVLKVFSQEKDIFNKKTILIILGDAENTGKTIGDEYLSKIKEKCKVVYWLHPKDKDEWYSSYSKLDCYEKYCKEVNQCSTLRQLDNFIKKITKL